MRTITDSNSKLSISREWEYIPFEELTPTRPKGYNKKRWAIQHGMISWYFLGCFMATGLDGTLNGIYITKDKPRTWQTDFTPPNGEPRHLAIEHDELTPAKLAEVCK